MGAKNTDPDVKEARKDTYYTTVVLNESRHKEYQFVFASQLYGTFFGIYAKFDVHEIGQKVKLNKINFRIINYKGLINIGIVSVKPIVPPKRKVNLRLIIELKGLMNPLQDYTLNLAKLDIHLGNRDKILIERSLIKFVENPDGFIDCGAFDQEFYFRDGLYSIDAPNSVYEHKIDKIEETDPEFIQKLGPRCPKTLAEVVTCK